MTIEELRQQINALIFTNIEKLISGDKVNIIMHYITDVIEEHIDNHDIHVTTQNKTNWNTAYGWGDHHGLYSDVNHNHELSKLLDIDDKDKDVGKILKVGLDGKTHEYVVDEEGTDEKIKYDSDDTTADYLSEKIIAGTNISLSEGTGPNENKLKINNTYTHPDTHPLSIIDESAIATDTPIDASRFHFWDTINNLWKAITWNNIKSTLKTYFDGIYGTLGLEHEQNTDTELICHGSVIDNFEEYENTADMKKNWTSQGPVISLPVISLDDTESYEGEKSMKVVGGLGESYDFDSCNIFINNVLFGQIGLNIAQDWKKYNFNLLVYMGQRIFSFMIVLISANGDEYPIYTSIPDFGDDFWNKSHDLEFWIKTGAAGSKTAWIDNITFDGESDKVITACEIRDHFESLKNVLKLNLAVFNKEYDNGDGGESVTIDWNNGQNQKLLLSDDCALTFTDIDEIDYTARLQLKIIQDGTGGWNLTFPANVIFPTEFDFSDGEADQNCIITFYYDGTNYIALSTEYYDLP